ncbi:MAG: O-antigen ligase family protein [Ruminococcus sp.]|jgi:O-antigen ligase|nr:O-antigen ligase family protein [Ruminococcus sp.]
MAKEIFGSSSESNFILNLNPKKVDKAAFYMLLCLFAFTAVAGIFMQFIGGLDLLPSMVLMVFGLAIFVLALISALKSMYDRQYTWIGIFFGLSIAFALVSSFLGVDYMTSLLGFEGRGEGVLALAVYYSVFLVASRFSKELTGKFFDIVIGIGLFHILWSILQIIPIGGWFKNVYKHLFAVLNINNYIPHGTLGSPFIMISLFAMLSMIAIVLFTKTQSKKKQIYYAVSACLFLFFMCKTSALAGIISAATVLCIGIITFLVAKIKDYKKWFVLMYSVLAVGVGIAACFVLPDLYPTTESGGEKTGFSYTDTGIIYTDSNRRLDAGGFLDYNYAPFDVSSPVSLYSYYWKDGFSNASSYPMGIGPDCYIWTQVDKIANVVTISNTFDKPYNDYLYILSTRGIMGMVAYAGILLIAFIKAKKSPQRMIVYSGGAAYLLCMMLNFSAIESAPLFFFILGLSFANYNRIDKIVDDTSSGEKSEPKVIEKTKPKKRFALKG